ncbi:septal ring lytic transglycosylase RlpA family protein [Derxia lacustris]|uniref:septal ring lytic transglycosylase RlpA family protein n=1 Tax=Derxia lacustris TaxID=764842 RepID=UPI0015937298|nr:septal ring lytic transglycosylase RlpA family protein [Derxia lacustris]
MSARLCLCLALSGLLVAGCSTAPKTAGSGPLKRGGGDYRRDGPSDASLAELAALPDPLPAVEPLKTGTMKPYTVMGRDYRPMTLLQPYDEQGVASWYGRQFHGLPTASGEPYDMHALSAAHTTLPIPSWARVTNLRNGRSTILRINDRGPFKDDRILDLSYAAAAKLDVVRTGSAPVRIELLLPAEIARIREERGREPAPLLAQAPAAAPPASIARVSATPLPTAALPTAALQTAPLDAAAGARGPDADVPTVAPTAVRSAPRDGASVAPLASAVPPVAPPARTDYPADGAASTWLQLGAFSSRDNAEAALSRVAPRLGALGERSRVVLRGNLFRVHVGPFASREEASTVRDQLASTLGERPVIVDQP